KGCTDSCGTEYKIEIRRGTNCGKQFWIWVDLGINPLEIGECYLVMINTGTSSCGHMITQIFQNKVICPECSTTCDDLGGACCDSGQTCIGAEIPGASDCLGYSCCNGTCQGINSAIIADHTTINKFDSIPNSWIEKAKERFRISYGHTSHGSQIISGMNVLKAKSNLYSFSNSGGTGILSIHDRIPSGDLGNPDRTTWATRTRTMLDNQNNDRNIVMWSWCGQADTSESNMQIYLDLMNQLELDYPDITFIYMTGHLTGTGENGNLNQRNNQIRDFCKTNNKTLFDFADIESYNPDGSYFLNQGATDSCSYDGGNWADEWCAANPSSDMCSTCSCAHSKSLNCNMKAMAFWWMLARLAGWSGE
ncbi:MAG: hypothetical protein DRP06_03710, partial [Candidatus Aenigmatarchaeota archaeon]